MKSTFSFWSLSLLVSMLLAPIQSFAIIQVTFLELRSSQGQLIQLERNGQFAHVAISYKDQWLHSHPFRGVEIISNETLEEMGQISAVVTISEFGELTPQQVRPFIGKPYDRIYSWSNDAIYCSELIAKILKIPPEPMNFAPELWPPQFHHLRGQPGLSPDDLMQIFEDRGLPASFR